MNEKNENVSRLGRYAEAALEKAVDFKERAKSAADPWWAEHAETILRVLTSFRETLDTLEETDRNEVGFCRESHPLDSILSVERWWSGEWGIESAPGGSALMCSVGTLVSEYRKVRDSLV